MANIITNTKNWMVIRKDSKLWCCLSLPVAHPSIYPLHAANRRFSTGSSESNSDSNPVTVSITAPVANPDPNFDFYKGEAVPYLKKQLKALEKYETPQGKFLNILGMLFVWSFRENRYQLVDKVYSLQSLKQITGDLFKLLSSINERGYVSQTSLECRFMKQIAHHLESLGYEEKILGNAEIPYTYWYNFIFINLYYLLEKTLRNLKVSNEQQIHLWGKIVTSEQFDCTHETLAESELELIADLEFCKKQIHSRLDQYLKVQIQKRGWTIIQNTYTGFDTEYELLNDKKFLNKLVSAQIAMQSRTLIKIPLYLPFDISYVHPLTSEISNIYTEKVGTKTPYKYTFQPDLPTFSEIKKSRSNVISHVMDKRIHKDLLEYNELKVLNNSLKHCISLIRNCLFQTVDDLNVSIVKILKSIKGIEYYEDSVRGVYVFSLPLTPMFTEISYPEGDTGFSMVDLLDLAKNKAVQTNFEHLFMQAQDSQKSTLSQNTIPLNTFRGSDPSVSVSVFVPEGSSPSVSCLEISSLDSSSLKSSVLDCSSSNSNSNSLQYIPSQDHFNSSDSSEYLNNLVRETHKSIHCVDEEIENTWIESKKQVQEQEQEFDLTGIVEREKHELKNLVLLEKPTVTHLVVYEKSEVTSLERLLEKLRNSRVTNPILPTLGYNLRDDYVYLIRIFDNLGPNLKLTSNPINLIKQYDKPDLKARVRWNLFFNDDTKISVSFVKNNYILAHYNAADLSMLSDFDEIKEKLSIVNKSFLTLGKPLEYKHTFVHIRDTMLLAPAGNQSLASLGKLYNTPKLIVSFKDIIKMGDFLKRDKKSFDDYAIQDAVITLKHSLAMEKFNFNLKQLGVPSTLSSLGRKYVGSEWSKIFDKHLPYQISGEYLMGNADEIQTPKGLSMTGDVGAHMSYFIANYKGGRNESFMYGVDEDINWIDYDLVSAYTTGMSDLSLPDYYKGELVNIEDLRKWDTNRFLTGYLIMNGEFQFPSNVKYPSIPCYVDKTTTVYPLAGTCFLTGPEYLLALHQGCNILIKSAFYIPPKEKYNIDKVKHEVIKPFHGIIKNVQALRREFPKGHINNMLYKEMGNGMYGNIVRGISNKKQFDSLTGLNSRVTATELSNPILAGWTTAFIRSVIGECLHNIQILGGKIVSVTTDGFITNIKDLESVLINELPEEDTILLRKYRELRQDLSGKCDALEIKCESKGVISWTTRGQLGLNSPDGKMVAATGFQRGGYKQQNLVSLFKNILKSSEKFFEFTRRSLRGAKDIFDKGGNVTNILKEQTFRMYYDNRRKIIEPYWFDKFKQVNLSGRLLDSEPLENINHCKKLRFLSKFPITVPFNKNNTNRAGTTYKSGIEIGVRNFIKAYYSKNESFGLRKNEFKYARELISFINGHKSTKGIKLSIYSISKLKNRKLFWQPVPSTAENLMFVQYIKDRFPYFREDLFLKDGHGL
jgi:hypothetical protein